MPCLIALSALIAPRIVLAILVVTTSIIGSAYNGFVVPILGFFFMPLTTLVYALAINYHGSLEGKWFFFTLLAALGDLGVLGGGVQTRRFMPNLDRIKKA